ncbi:Dyp-type peroxidase [Nocardiopsis alba]|uniref:Dyp-type peroxidase n=1 Tax=Nocardiopsis alba TaxID=53437 RepID=UPI0034066453
MTEGPSRRGLFAGAGAAGAVGLVAGGLFGAGATRGSSEPDPARELMLAAGGPAEGLVPALRTPAPAHVHVVAVDLTADTPSAVAAQARAVLEEWHDRAGELHESGLASVVEGAPTQGLRPASLGITLGLGPSLLERAGLEDRWPEALADPPAFDTDRLVPALCGGDLMLHVGAEDPVVVGSAVRHLLGRVREHTRVRWSLPGFQRSAAAAEDPSATPRNLMGQIDGTVNPSPGEAVFSPQVLASHTDPAEEWMDGGTYVVVRRIRMLLDDWFDLSKGERERVVGRRLDDGAPLGGEREEDLPDLSARDEDGEPVIPADAHIRLAGSESTMGARMLRRGFNYDLGLDADGEPDTGLLFTAWQGDPNTGFTAVQRRLDEGGDALNRYVRHEGSAVFAVPPLRDDEPFVSHGLWT